jgi:predicted MFS family arabinose efflux permease
MADRQENASLLRQVPGFAPLLLATLLAKSGATMVGLAMGFVAYQQTASALAVAIVVSSFGIAFALASLIAGHVLQRVGLRTMLVGALASQIAGALALASVTSTAGADATWLTLCGLSSGLASAFIYLGSQMLIHGLAPDEHLERAVSLDAAASSLSRIAGPALGGVLLAEIGIPPVFLIAAVGYVPLAIVVAVVATPVAARDPGHRPNLREAARFFRRLPLLRWALITAALAETLALPLVIMLPAVTASLNRDSADRLGILVACVAVGSVGQVVILTRLRARLDARWIAGVAYGAAGVVLLGLALGGDVFVAGALLVVFGLSVSLGRTLLMTCVHVGSPDSHRHHVLSLYLFVTSAATPIGALIWGGMADLVGIDATVGGSGLVLVLGIVVVLVWILHRHADAPPAVAPTAAAPAGD